MIESATTIGQGEGTAADFDSVFILCSICRFQNPDVALAWNSLHDLESTPGSCTVVPGSTTILLGCVVVVLEYTLHFTLPRISDQPATSRFVKYS